ncbi:MAG TPA: ATP-binding cassette domain-containing protein, partial [Nocardioides sp.]|nr:ATP-binding cassette domain-containing protein [Nocardioides sp.]
MTAPALAKRSTTDTLVSVRGVTKTFAGRGRRQTRTALEGFDLDVREGEFLCLLGPSGCGKSTLLSLMAGFAAPSSGTIELDGQPVGGPGPELGFVFQSSDALFDWLTVADNIAFGPRMRGIGKAERAAVVAEHLRLVGLTGAAGKRPPQLSGGMRQRVQIAR